MLQRWARKPKRIRTPGSTAVCWVRMFINNGAFGIPRADFSPLRPPPAGRADCDFISRLCSWATFHTPNGHGSVFPIPITLHVPPILPLIPVPAHMSTPLKNDPKCDMITRSRYTWIDITTMTSMKSFGALDSRFRHA